MSSEEARPRVGDNEPAGKFVRLDELRRLRGSEQVAAVCYRHGKDGLQFLLVRTRGGRWTFPKGSAEPGLTKAQAAALEAFEEGGVHGRMEEAAFMQYVRRKRSSGIEIVVSAHLCEVVRLDRAPEAGRDPTWFAAEKAMKKLREDRAYGHGLQLAEVIERATERIRLKR